MTKLWLLKGLRPKQCTSAVPPSAAQMTTSQTKQTSIVANCRIHVEQAIKKKRIFGYSKEKYADDIKLFRSVKLENLKSEFLLV